MRSRTPLALMEQLVMILVFALAAAFCLRIFVLSDRISKDNQVFSYALFEAQNTAELLKETGGDWEQTLIVQGWIQSDGCWRREVQEGLDDYRLEIEESMIQEDEICRIEIRVIDGRKSEEERVLVQFPVAWQEVSGHD